MLDGLAPSHRLIQNMQPQLKQRTHGNDFIANCIRPGYEAKYRHCRYFFAVKDPMMIPPPKLQCLNYKVDKFFRWNRHIWKEVWTLNKNFSIDEQTYKMQGKSEYKTRCGKFKRIGDGIQTDCMADYGYTYDFYFCNEPVDQKCLDMGMCVMHSRLLHIFVNLKTQGHWCNMDNLFNSVKLAREAYSLWARVLIHGVIRKSIRGVPPCVLQEELTGNREDATQGTAEAAILEGESESCQLIITSCYDQKPFYMIFHSTPSVTWIALSKRIYSHKEKETVNFNFLRFNMSNEYDFKINDNDVADQYRLVYSIDGN